ncbi:MAG: hypothetical protein AAGK14_06135 [Verrucomicrobiota bacterium]
MLRVLFALFLLLMGFWLWMGSPATDPQGKYFGEWVHQGFVLLERGHPYTTILAFVFAIAILITLKKD